MAWYIGNHVSEKDSNIKSLRLPNLISIIPQNIERFQKLQGLRVENFFLFWANVVWLFNRRIFPTLFTACWSNFSFAKRFNFADWPVKCWQDFKTFLFCVKVPRLYGNRYQTYNVYNLLHNGGFFCKTEWTPLGPICILVWGLKWRLNTFISWNSEC